MCSSLLSTAFPVSCNLCTYGNPGLLSRQSRETASCFLGNLRKNHPIQAGALTGLFKTKSDVLNPSSVLTLLFEGSSLWIREAKRCSKNKEAPRGGVAGNFAVSSGDTRGMGTSAETATRKKLAFLFSRGRAFKVTDTCG